MKTKFNFFAIALISGLFILPLGVFGQSNVGQMGQDNKGIKEPGGTGQSGSLSGNFCANLNSIEQKILAEQNKWQKNKSEVLNNIEKRAEEREIKMLENRARWDANRMQHFDLLEEHAGTDLQRQQAVREFQQAIELAIKNRRLATDSAMKEFTNAVRVRASSDLDGINQARLEFTDKVKNAIGKAKGLCDETENVISTREELVSSLKEAQKAFRERVIDLKGVDVENKDISSYVSLKNQKIQEAHSVFQQALVNARESLLTAFGINNTE